MMFMFIHLMTLMFLLLPCFKGEMFSSPYFLSNIVFTIPLSIIVSNTFCKIISTIGPMNNPIIPENLKPVYIAINVNTGCIPILFPTTLGSSN